MARTEIQGKQTRKSLFLALCALLLRAPAPAHQNAHTQRVEPSEQSAPGAQESDAIPVDLPVKDRQSLETLQAIFMDSSVSEIFLGENA